MVWQLLFKVADFNEPISQRYATNAQCHEKVCHGTSCGCVGHVGVLWALGQMQTPTLNQ